MTGIRIFWARLCPMAAAMAGVISPKRESAMTMPIGPMIRSASGGAHGSSGFHHRGSGSSVGTEREKRLSGTEFLDFFYEGAPHASALTVDDDNFFHNG